MTHPLHGLNDIELERLAGSAAMERGVSYCLEDRVTHLQTTPNGLEAEVAGSSQYRLWIRDDHGRLGWFCDCPAAEDGDFCKHLVAAVLTLRDEGTPDLEPEGELLLETLMERPKTQLAEWLLEAALRDADLHQRLRLRLAVYSPQELEARIEDLLEPDQALDYTGSWNYARQLKEVADLLEEYSLDDPQQAALLCERALKQGLAHYRNADDSAGGIGDRLRDLADIHSDTCHEADHLGEDFAERLYHLKRRDEWDLFPLSDYWTLLGETGQALYGERVLDAREASGAEADAFYSHHLRAELAEQQGDADTLIDLFREELPAWFAYRNLIRVCRQHGRLDDALHWTEQAAAAHPNDPEFHQELAHLYQDTGRTDEALKILWRGFQRHLDLSVWDELLDLAGSDRDAWYQRARETLMEREPAMSDFHRSSLVGFFIHNNDAARALPLAWERDLATDTLLQLADALHADHPDDAAGLLKRVVEHQLHDAVSKRYPFAVHLMKRVRHYAPSAGTDAWIAGLRRRFARRPALMRRMDKAGL